MNDNCGEWVESMGVARGQEVGVARCCTRRQFLQVVLHSVPTDMCGTTDTALQKVNE